MRYINYPKLILAGVFTLYFAWIAYDPMRGSFLDMVDLPIHEAGHLIWGVHGDRRRFTLSGDNAGRFRRLFLVE